VTTPNCPVGIVLIGLPDEINHELERNVQVKLARCFEKWNANHRNGERTNMAIILFLRWHLIIVINFVY
jgi:hypothetical protein